jgi:hypothetical protein
MLNKLLTAIDRVFGWLDSLRTRRIAYEPVAIPFPPIEVGRFVRELNLDAEGTTRGQQDFPAPDNFLLDEVEHRIVTAIEAERNKATDIASDYLRTYDERLGHLQIQRLLQRASVAADEARTNFGERVYKGKGRLFLLKETLSARSRELAAFKAEHRLDRPSNRPDALWLRWGIVALLWLIEAILNGAFLSRGLEFGLIEGVGIALAIAAINIGSGLVAGMFLLRQKNHRSALQRVVGVTSFIVYMGAAVVLNILVAHYRDALGASDPDNAASNALSSFLTRPFAIADLNSVFLLVMGISFSFGAAVDGYHMDDPYPGYGTLCSRHRDELESYREGNESEVGDLQATRDRALSQLEQEADNIETRRAQYRGVLDKRKSFRQSFTFHLDHLEQAGNELLAHYRAANVRARRAPAPEHFSAKWTMARPALALENANAGPPFPDAEAERVLERLAETRRTILQLYESARAEYASIEELVQNNE